MSEKSRLFPMAPLGGMLSLEYGSALPETLRTGAGFPVFGSNGVVGRHSSYLIEGPGIIVGRKGSVGRVCWSAESFWPIDTAYYVAPKNQASLRWIYWMLSFADLKRFDAATGVPGLNRNDVYEARAPLADPPVQSCIAAVLDTVDEAIAKTGAVIAKLKQVRAGLLHDLLTRGLDEHGQLRDPIAHPEQFQDSPLGRIPREWTFDRLEHVATLQRGFDLPLQERHEGSIPIFGSNGIDGWHDERGVAGPGVITGRSGTIGLVHFCPSDYWPLNTTLYVKDFHGNRPHYSHLLLSAMRLERFSASTGVPSLNRNFVHPTLVSVPPPIEQDAIYEVVRAHDLTAVAEGDCLKKLMDLKSGLMTELLTGRVRVPESMFAREGAP